MRSPLRTFLAAATGVAACLALPSVAHAVPISPDVVITAEHARDYVVEAKTRYWSVIAVQPKQDENYDLDLYERTSPTLWRHIEQSAVDPSRTDFIAIDSNVGRRPLGDYTATTIPQFISGVGATTNWVQWAQGRTVISLPRTSDRGTTGTDDPDIRYVRVTNDKVVSVADIHLEAGESFWASSRTAGSKLFLLGSTPGEQDTYVQNRRYAERNNYAEVVDGCTRYKARQGGWYGLLLVRDEAVTGDTRSGTGIALHRHDPARPTICPLRNFPQPTP